MNTPEEYRFEILCDAHRDGQYLTIATMIRRQGQRTLPEWGPKHRLFPKGAKMMPLVADDTVYAIDAMPREMALERLTPVDEWRVVWTLTCRRCGPIGAVEVREDRLEDAMDRCASAGLFSLSLRGLQQALRQA